MYYRVALQAEQASTWRWKSTVLTSIEAVLGFLRIYRCVPKDHVRVFLCSSAENMDEMLRRENQGMISTSIPADQLWAERSMSLMEMRRLELELCSTGDHDVPYTFSIPSSVPQVLAWTKLLAKVQRGELEP